MLPSARLSACVHGFERPPGCSSPMFFRLHFSVHVLILFGHRVQNTRKRNQYGVCEVPIMVGFGLFLFPRSQKTINFQKTGPKIEPKCPYLPFFSLRLLFGVWNRTKIMLSRTTRNCPWRMNASPEQETGIIYVTYVRTKGYRYTRTHHAFITISHEGQALEARPCRREAGANAGEVMWWRVGRLQMQHR